MSSINFVSKYKKDSGVVISPGEIASRYLFGVPLCAANGKKFEQKDFALFIKSSQIALEQALDIKLKKQIYSERCDFIYDQWKSWGYIKTTLPINKAHKLVGFLNSVQQVEYPVNWVSLSQNSTDQYRNGRNMYIVPNGAGTPVNGGSVVYLGISPHLGFYSMDYVPNYWDVTYCTGFDKVPENIISVLGKITAIQVLNVLGDTVFTPGLNSQSLSLDGLSQSVSTSVSNNVFKQRITQYTQEIDKEMKLLREIYRGISYFAL